MSTQCPLCGWFYSAGYKPVGSECANTAQLPAKYKAQLSEQGIAWPACRGIVVEVKKTLDRGRARD
jgi:hypothetical protein